MYQRCTDHDRVGAGGDGELEPSRDGVSTRWCRWSLGRGDHAASQRTMIFRTQRRTPPPSRITTALCVLLATCTPTVMAQNCISLSGSSTCPAFNGSSVSTDSALVGLFPFLSHVTDRASFDSGLSNYISQAFTEERYGTLIGCSNLNLANTTDFYARYTTSVLCNAIVQSSITTCGLTGNATRPLCADSCASYAESEEAITNSNVCGSHNSGYLSQIRADFTNCALPADSLSTTCIEAVDNQPDNCGYGSNLASLCSYCAASSPNATDSCCVYSDTTTRCQGVVLPIVASSSLQPVTASMTVTMSVTSTATSGALASHAHRGLTGGQIAGIVVGSVLGALLLLALLIGSCFLLRRRQDSSPGTSVFNQPATTRQQPPTAYNDGARDVGAGMGVLGGGRVARMAALEGSSGDEMHGGGFDAVGAFGGYRKSTSDDEEESTPGSRGLQNLAPPPKRSGSLSSGSQLAFGGLEDASPSTNNDYTSPESQGQSEQLGFFKDYYSQDEIHPGDQVATLWAYEPRAADEFHLERGDMIKVVGIWDDGWATGVRVRARAEDWISEGRTQRDSGMSNGSSRPPGTSDGEGEVKAFPLVCVCLPQHWRKTIEGDSTEGSGPIFD